MRAFMPPGAQRLLGAPSLPPAGDQLAMGRAYALQGIYGPDRPTAGDSPSEVGAVPAMPESRHVSSARVQQYLLGRVNPIRNLTPTKLANALENFDYGYFRDASQIWEKVRDRDDQVKTVCEKREIKPTDMPWDITTVDDTPEAQKHKEALNDFYSNLTVTNAVEQNRRGGVQLLIQQMMRAVGDRFSVHEIIWKPDVDLLTAEFRFVPLWFFEGRSGKLRFLPFEGATTGIDLEPAGWVVHSGPGLFVATCIAYIYKQLGLKSWVNFNDKYGIPFLHGKTSAAFESQEWEQMEAALRNFSSDGSILTSSGAEIEAVQTTSAGSIPMEPFTDRMDRAIGRLWNGGDLHSMSRDSGNAIGSNPQQLGQDDLAKADAERLSETLNAYVDRWVIKYKFGVDKPLARFVLQAPDDPNIAQDLKVDEFLLGVCPSGTLSLNDMLERYGRSKAAPGEDALENPGEKALTQIEDNQNTLGENNAPAKPIAAPGTATPLANVRFAQRKQYNVTSTDVVADELARVFEPLKKQFDEAAKIRDPEHRLIRLQQIDASLPRFLKQNGLNPELVSVIAKTMSTALVSGAAAGAQATNGYRNGSH